MLTTPAILPFFVVGLAVVVVAVFRGLRIYGGANHGGANHVSKNYDSIRYYARYVDYAFIFI